MRVCMFLLCVFCLLFSLVAGEKEHELRLKLKKGEKLYYQTKNRNDSKALQGKNTSETVSVVEHRVEEVEEERAKVNMDILKLKYKGNDGVFDSEKEKSSVPQSRADVFNALVDEELKVKVKPNGEVEKVEGEEELKKEVAESMKDDPMTKMLPETMREGLAESLIRNAYGLFLFQFLPNEKVSVGDTWTVEQRQPLMKLVWEAKLKSVRKKRKKQIATIILTLKDVSLQAGGGNNPLVGMLDVGEKQGSGKIEFNITDGRTLSFSMSLHCSIKSRMNNAVVYESKMAVETKLLKKPPKIKK